MGLAEHWEHKEQLRQELVPPSFASPTAQRRLRLALWSRVLVGVAVLTAVIGLGVGGAVTVPALVVGAGLGAVGLVIGVVSVRRLARLEQV